MVSKQIYFMLNQDLGFRKEAIITFETPFDTIATRQAHILNKIASLPEVQLVSKGFLPPAMEGAAFANIAYNETKANAQIRFGDANYLELYKIELVSGRNVRDGENIDEVLINESYAKELGLLQPTDPLGKELTFGNGKKVTIVGVMRDFHEGSLHKPIGPVVFQSRTNGRIFHVALHPQQEAGGQWQEAIRKIQQAVTEVYPDMDFKYSFFDDALLQLYTRERNISRLLNWATGLSILISCLGLLGLVMYTATTRTKEIGIRKILGATVSAIVSLLSGQFIRLVMIAFIIAAPIAWWAVDQWLHGFAYRTPISWWVFVASGLMLIFAALITLAIQTVKTARANPVESLRVE
jgi:ABC-type antimicrobial peptide transport system permease subunit